MEQNQYNYTPRERKYACLIAEGIPEYIAYKEAGFGENSKLETIRGNASRLATKEKIKALVEEIQVASMSKTVKSIAKDIEYRRESLAELYEKNKDEKVNPVWPIQELNKMDKVYTEGIIDNRKTINIIVTQETKSLIDSIKDRDIPRLLEENVQG